ncbi:hypothetical protein SJAV_27600 [Sulfurisphaera javensis]|uniref:DUF1102 domain-containing protein n=1 Tax=Sulfurisphaera javensis TaxID=2049879 RepID=A0AAT9GVP7_9CREN
MQKSTKALLFGVTVGILLISMVASLTFYYTATRDIAFTIVADNMANVALVANDSALGSYANVPFVSYNGSGDLEINGLNVALNANETLKDVFYITNNLNQSITVTVTVKEPTAGEVYVQESTGAFSTSATFTLAPGASQAITIEILTYGVSAGVSPETAYITIQAVYSPPPPSGGS